MDHRARATKGPVQLLKIGAHTRLNEAFLSMTH